MIKRAGLTLGWLALLVPALLFGDLGELQTRETDWKFNSARSTSYDYDVVLRCLRDGNGSHIFEDYQRVSVAVPMGTSGHMPASTFHDQSGSILVVERLDGQTEVRLRTTYPITDDQKDLLGWCIENPQLTWIAPEFRSD
ncbi:MAG: hypothetical protein WA985_05300 [Erythrobacter sp.]